MHQPVRRVLALLLLSAMCPATFADTDEPPLLVEPVGFDAGDCVTAGRPCRTIGYALDRVGKNGRIRVAAGHYALQDPTDVFYLVSNAIDVRAEPGTTLVGVPHEFARDLEARGFRIIADVKGLDRQVADKLAATRDVLQAGMQASACAGGLADGFPCASVDLLARVNDRASTASGADIWGFLDLNTHREYAIMGYSTGTAVYDVTDPENPREVGFVDGQQTTWRDIKVYQSWNDTRQRFDAYAYVTADNASDGLFILDLTELPQRISRVDYASDFSEAHNVYISRADFGTGLALTDMPPLLLIAGSDRSDGRFRTYSLENPRSPDFIAAPATPAGQSAGNRLYMHDAASMLVTDARKDTQCVNASGSPFCDVVFDFNESTLDIWDVTDPANPWRLSQTPYDNSGYSHSGWWSEDRQFVFLQDELDERDRGLMTTLRVFSLADLRNPALTGAWNGPTRAIDHNGFARGNRYYMSNYARGLTVLDITNPATPVEVGRFDTYPPGDATGFPGAWGTYPFLPSGNILVSDIDSGLYVVADRTLDVPQGSLSFAAASYGADEGSDAAIVVQRNGGGTGAVSVAWEILGATGSRDDVGLSGGVLSWAAGDTGDKMISVPVTSDATAESLERLLVRLTAPAGGATLAAPAVASLYISDSSASPTVAFADTQIAVPERGFATAIVVLHRYGSAAGAVSVDFDVTAGDAVAGTDYDGPASGTIRWADGDADPKNLEFAIADDGSSESSEFFELTLANVTGGAIGTNDTLRVHLLDGTGASSAPNAVAGANQTVASGARVTLDGSGSNDPDGDTLAYSWTQTMGPAVTIDNADAASAAFTAPTVQSDTLLRFQLEVTDTQGQRSTALATVTVRNSSSGGRSRDSGGGTLSFWLLALLLFERMRSNNRLFAIRPR